MDKKNVLGTQLQPCSFSPLTGYMRDGHCDHCESDTGQHTVCAEVNEAFLEFSKNFRVFLCFLGFLGFFRVL